MKKKLSQSARVFLAVVLAVNLSTWGGAFSAYGLEPNESDSVMAAQDVAAPHDGAEKSDAQKNNEAKDAASAQAKDAASAAPAADDAAKASAGKAADKAADKSAGKEAAGKAADKDAGKDAAGTTAAPAAAAGDQSSNASDADASAADAATAAGDEGSADASDDASAAAELAATALAASAAMTLAADEGDHPAYTHQAVTRTTGAGEIRVLPIGSAITTDTLNAADVAYCYDRNNDYPIAYTDGTTADPDKNANKYWVVENVDGAQFVGATNQSERRTKVDGVALTDDQFRSRVIAVVANGYPRNASGFLGKYPSLSASKQREVTQKALWYYTNSGTAYGLSGDALKLFNDLIAASKTYEAPEGHLQGLNLYITDQSHNTSSGKRGYQNLLSVTDEFVYIQRGAVEIRIDGEKILENGILTDKQFSFSIWKQGKENGTPIQTVRNNAKGAFVFNNLGTVQAGDKFTIKENVNADDDSIIYDTTVYTAEAYTNADGDIAFKLSANNREVKKLVFENYQGPEEFEVEFSKINVGGEEIAGAEIQIFNAAQEVVADWTSEEGQSIKFRLPAGTYTFHEEAAPTGYKVVTDVMFAVDGSGNVTVLGNHGNATAENNRLTVVDDFAETSVSVTKQWTDDDNRDNLRPTTLTVNLYANGKKTDQQLTLVAPLWTGTFANLRMYDDAGQPYNYTVKEAAVPEGYTYEGVTGSMADGFVITNAHTPATTQVQGKKIWNDGNNADGKRLEKVTVALYADGVYVDQKEVTAAAAGANQNEWLYSFDNLPQKDGGRAIVYTVQELNVPAGYSSTIIDNDITNSYTPDTVNVQVKKAWEDANNQDGIRPTSVTVHLWADGVDTGKTVILDEGNGWSASFDGLPQNENGQPISYTITEDEVAGYQTKIEATDDGNADGNDGNGGDDGDDDFGLDLASLFLGDPDDANAANESHLHFAVTNTHEPATTKVSGTKHWNDANDQDGKRPAEVTIDLYADGAKVDSKTVTAADGWKYTFENLPLMAAGKQINYTVNEPVVAQGYTKSINGYDVTNAYTPSKTSLTVNKDWEYANNQDGLRPSSIEVTLYKNGKPTQTKIELNAGNGWQGVFENLDAFEAGKRIEYSAQEQTDFANNDAYTSSVIVARDGGTYTFVNAHEPARVTVRGEKTWVDEGEDQRPAQITVLLKKAGQTIDTQTVTPDSDGKWSYSFEGLPKFENGNAIRYSVQEDQVADDYQSSVSTKVDADGNVTCDIVNKHEVGKVAIQVTKSWEDYADQDGIRPASVTVHLLADGVDTGKSVVLNEKNNWTANFDSLDKTKEVDGRQVAIDYTVTEDQVAGYDTTITPHQGGRHFTVTNTHTPETTSVKVTKVWKDNDNALQDRPEYVVLQLLATYGGQTVPAMNVTVDAEDGWSYEFENLPKNIGGQAVSYSVAEAGDTSKYDVVVTGSQEDGFTVTNTEIVNKVTFSKQDLGGKEIAGADIDIINADSFVVDSWTSVEGESHVTELSPGNYYFSEVSAPKGYVAVTGILFHVDEKGAVTVLETNGNTVTVDEQTGALVVTDLYQDQVLTVKKTDLGGHEIGGADVSVLNAKGHLVERWKSVEGEEHSVVLQPGTYTFHEEAAPKGYVVVTDITFTVDHLGVVTVVKDADSAASVDGQGALVVVDQYADQKVSISKTDINGTEEIAGAELVLKSQDGQVVGSWTSQAGKSHEVVVQPGTYTLTETTAPQGYKVAESITFTVDHLGRVTVDGQDVDQVVMKDDYANGKVVISKTDVAGKEIAGAKLEVKDKDGQVVESWESEAGKNHEVELYPGTYTLVETTAPQGYEVAESITFTVDHQNNVTVDGKAVGQVAMVDQYASHTVAVSKVDVAGQDVVGAHIVVKDADGQTVGEWETKAGEKHELALKPGTYTFHEESAPKGYLAVTDLTFSVDIEGKVTVANAAGNTVTVDEQTGALVVTDQYDLEEEPRGNEVTDEGDDGDGGSSGHKGKSFATLAQTGDPLNLVGLTALAVISGGLVLFLRRKMSDR